MAVRVISHHITSALSRRSSLDNVLAVRRRLTALKHYSGGTMGLPEDFTAARLPHEALKQEAANWQHAATQELTRFETAALHSAHYAVADARKRYPEFDPASERTLFVLSTTKGNVELLACPPQVGGSVLLGPSARKIAALFGNRRAPLVVSNACISGLCAIIAAQRAIESGNCDHAVVIGCDVLSPFIIAGFQSFKALSPEPCRPFDKHRSGLNLGEASATVVLARDDNGDREAWRVVRGAVCNDANHISGPSRTAEGSYRALLRALGNETPDGISMVSVHGTATAYNDEMESIALHRAGLDNRPVAAYKGYYGHTLGAAGVLESILSMEALDNHFIPVALGYRECGVSHPLDITREDGPERHCEDAGSFIKLLSGFGGCNAAVLFKKGVLR